LLADSDGGALLTTTLGEFTAVELVLVATVKLKLPLGSAVGPAVPALKVTVTVEPAGIEGQDDDCSVITRPLALALVLVALPAWRHDPEIKATVASWVDTVETTALLSESPMVIVLPVASAFTATKVIV
jgi:hypothetical protein